MTMNSYQELLTLTQSMLLQCEKKDWEAFATIEHKRQAIIDSLKTNPPIKKAEDIEIIQEIISINNRLIKISQSDQKKNEHSLLSLTRNLKKSSLYNQ